jgi:hypothetical protein
MDFDEHVLHPIMTVAFGERGVSNLIRGFCIGYIFVRKPINMLAGKHNKSSQFREVDRFLYSLVAYYVKAYVIYGSVYQMYCSCPLIIDACL